MPVAHGSPSSSSSSGIVGNLSHGFTSMGVNAEAWSIPAYIATQSDPLRNHTRRDRNAQGGCSPPHYCTRMYPTNRFLRRTPAAAAPAVGSDAHLVVISPDHRTAMAGFGCAPGADAETDARARGELGGFSCVGSGVNVDLMGNGWDCCGAWAQVCTENAFCFAQRYHFLMEIGHLPREAAKGQT
jgi:hypothetical protein